MTLLGEFPDGDAEPERLELLAAAAYGIGDLEAALTAWEDLHAMHGRLGETVPSARAAVMVAMYLLMDTGLMAPVRAWLARAERLLLDQPETPVHALIAMLRGYERFYAGDLVAVRAWADRAVELGDRWGVAPASTLGRVAGARTRIFEGDIDGGIEVLDEVAVMLMSGEVDPLTAGMVYCELICAMQGLGEYDRADEWTRTMDAWRGHGDFFGGINGRCRVHRAEMLRLRGRCEEAEDEALHACEELRPWMRREFGWPLTELGMIRLLRGDLAGAEESFRAAHAGGWEPQPGLALLRLAQGQTAAASSLICDALENPIRIPWKERPPVEGLTRVPLLDACVVIAIAADDLPGAELAADELETLADTYPSPAIRATSCLARGRVAMALGDHELAIASSREAVDARCALGIPYEAAMARLVFAEALRATGDDALAATQEDTATRAFADIGAVPILAISGCPTSEHDTDVPNTPDMETSTVFRCDGDTRTLTFTGTTVLLRDLKGMRYLERLLAEPDREFHALDLVAVEAGTLPTAGPAAEHGDLALGSDDAGPHLDDQARRAYRRRLQEIEEDIAEAETMRDPERAALAKMDRDFIVTELSRAFGLGGRRRPSASGAERARMSVTRALRYSLGRIAEQHPTLADHLESTVSTGTYCVYAPDPRVPITWIM
jgi:tetratricopeptide (TPR) repeat protein